MRPGATNLYTIAISPSNLDQISGLAGPTPRFTRRRAAPEAHQAADEVGAEMSDAVDPDVRALEDSDARGKREKEDGEMDIGHGSTSSLRLRYVDLGNLMIF